MFTPLPTMRNTNLASSLRASQRIATDSSYAISVVEDLMQSIPSPTNSDTESASSLRTVQLLRYHYIKILIARVMTRPPNQPGTDTTFGGAFSDANLRKAVLDFVSFIKSIRTDATQVFWPPWCPTVFSTLCFTLLSAVVTSRSEHEAAEWLSVLQSTRRELRLKASTLPVLRLGLLRIDAIFWRGLDKVLRLEPHVQAAVRATVTAR